MTGDGGLRRLLPPPRRRPGLLAILIRWRVELLILGGIVTASYHAGLTAVIVAALMVALLATLIPPVGRVVLGVVLAVVVPHRVRSGLVQSGVVDRTGRPPWIMWARPSEDSVLLDVWLRAGTTTEDIREAAPVIAAATGATSVDVGHRSARRDRAVLVVRRPRWGWPGR
jgi:hypothetical protein